MRGCCGRLGPVQHHLTSITCERIPGFKNVRKPAEGWWKMTSNQLESEVTIMCNTISVLLSLQMPLKSCLLFNYLVSIALSYLRVQVVCKPGIQAAGCLL